MCWQAKLGVSVQMKSKRAEGVFQVAASVSMSELIAAARRVRGLTVLQNRERAQREIEVHSFLFLRCVAAVALCVFRCICMFAFMFPSTGGSALVRTL